MGKRKKPFKLSFYDGKWVLTFPSYLADSNRLDPRKKYLVKWEEVGPNHFSMRIVGVDGDGRD